MRKLLVICSIIVCLAAGPVLASETSAREGFLNKLQNCLDLYQSQQEDFKSLDLVQENTYNYGSTADSSSGENTSNIRINFDSQQASFISTYQDSYTDSSTTNGLSNETCEYYLDGKHYYSEYDRLGVPIPGKYYYDEMPFENVLYNDIRSGIPDYSTIGDGLEYLTGIMPDSSFLQDGSKGICIIDQADIDAMYGDLALSVQDGDPDAIAAMEILYPGLGGFEFDQEGFLQPLYPDQMLIGDTKGMPEEMMVKSSYSLRITVDNASLSTRSLSSNHIVYGAEMDGSYEDYKNTVDTVLNARTGQFSRNSLSSNKGVMPDYSMISSQAPPVPREGSPEDETAMNNYYENTSSSSAVYNYSRQEGDLNMPKFNEENSQQASSGNMGTSYWSLIN